MSKEKVIITPHGGHGSSYLCRRLKAIVRPDTVIGKKRIDVSRWIVDTDLYMSIKAGKEWMKRTGRDPDYSVSFRENLLRLIKEESRWVVLCGAASSVKPFLANYKIPAYCIVRNPVNAYASFFCRQHPEHAAIFGGPDSHHLVRIWCDSWVKILLDVAGGGGQFSDYELFPSDIDNEELANIDGFVPSQNKEVSLLNTTQGLIRALTGDIYRRFVK